MGTHRQQMMELLGSAPMSARDLSQAIGISEKDVIYHLGHLAQSVSARGKKLVILPFGCLSCGYVFKARKHYTRPGRCPRCRKSHLENPAFRILP